MLKNGRTMDRATKGCSFSGCSCHNSKKDRRKGKKSVKAREKRAWQKDQSA